MLPSGPVPVFESEIDCAALGDSTGTAPKDKLLALKVAIPLLGAACADSLCCGNALETCRKIPTTANAVTRPKIRSNTGCLPPEP